MRAHTAVVVQQVEDVPAVVPEGVGPDAERASATIGRAQRVALRGPSDEEAEP
jgi:hypothetical protein